MAIFYDKTLKNGIFHMWTNTKGEPLSMEGSHIELTQCPPEVLRLYQNYINESHSSLFPRILQLGDRYGMVVSFDVGPDWLAQLIHSHPQGYLMQTYHEILRTAVKETAIALSSQFPALSVIISSPESGAEGDSLLFFADGENLIFQFWRDVEQLSELVYEQVAERFFMSVDYPEPSGCGKYAVISRYSFDLTASNVFLFQTEAEAIVFLHKTFVEEKTQDLIQNHKFEAEVLENGLLCRITNYRAVTGDVDVSEWWVSSSVYSGQSN